MGSFGSGFGPNFAGVNIHIPKCDNCGHLKNVHASFVGHSTHCTMIVDAHNTICNCKKFIEKK